ncbi:hypothetical protein [Candidatus Binatus soli]|jgi:hypothetical protein|uniref:hypothetical protein n=1 Tax=Candidatus Binatus soli TaxID=1953413 RepID=UPI003D1292C7
MAITTLEGVESIRILRAAGNLKISGANRSAVEIDTNTAPELARDAGVAEMTLRGNATIAVPAGVTVEVEDLAGDLNVSDLATPFAVKRVRGNLHARRIGAISIRDTVSGNVSIKEAGSVEGLKVRGALSVESAHAIAFSLVAGEFDCRAIDGEVAIEKIAGGARLLGLHGPFIARIVGGHLEIEDGAHVEAGVVGGKVRASNLSGAIRIGKIGGKLAADSIAGEIAVGFVGGSARIGRVGGALNLEDVGGAVYLAGPFPADKTWSVRSRGRVNVEVEANASLELDASAGWGRIRTYGVDAAGLKWLGRNHVHGPIGPDPASGARLKLAVETRGADVIVASADARERDFSGRGYRSRMSGAFSAPFEDLADELGGEIPAFVRSVLDAAGQFVAESGGMSSTIVREVTRDVKRSVSEGLHEVERAVAEIEESVPGDVGDRLAKLGKEIGDLVADAVRGGSREARHEMRERVRHAAREMRDKIREAARNVRDRSHDRAGSTTQSATGSTTQSNTQSDAETPASDSQSAKFTPGATEKLSRDDAILEILAAVKDGRLEPDEADDLINAWMEVSRGADARR